MLRDRLAKTVRIHKNSVARSMRRLQLEQSDDIERRGRPKKYTKDVDAALYTIWEAMDKPCAEILHPMIGTYVEALISADRWHYHDLTIPNAKPPALLEESQCFTYGPSANICVNSQIGLPSR